MYLESLVFSVKRKVLHISYNSRFEKKNRGKKKKGKEILPASQQKKLNLFMIINVYACKLWAILILAIVIFPSGS